MKDPSEIWRAASASFQWITGAPFLCYKMAYHAADQQAARGLIAAHCAKFQRTCGFGITVDGPAPNPGSGCVVVHNETSFIDTIAWGVSIWPYVDRASGTDLYAYVPFLRAAMEKAGVELVPRGDRQGTDRVLTKMVDAVQLGERVAWTGEGRIVGFDGIGRFKVGSSLIAIRAGAPIVPLVSYGGHQIMPLRSIRAKPGHVRIRFGTPIPTDGLPESEARDLADHVQQTASRIYAELKDLSAAS